MSIGAIIRAVEPKRVHSCSSCASTVLLDFVLASDLAYKDTNGSITARTDCQSGRRPHLLDRV